MLRVPKLAWRGSGAFQDWDVNKSDIEMVTWMKWLQVDVHWKDHQYFRRLLWTWMLDKGDNRKRDRTYMFVVRCLMSPVKHPACIQIGVAARRWHSRANLSVRDNWTTLLIGGQSLCGGLIPYRLWIPLNVSLGKAKICSQLEQVKRWESRSWRRPWNWLDYQQKSCRNGDINGTVSDIQEKGSPVFRIIQLLMRRSATNLLGPNWVFED